MLELVSCAIKYSIVLEAEGMHTGTLMQVQVGMHSWRAQDRVQPELRQAPPERHACALMGLSDALASWRTLKTISIRAAMAVVSAVGGQGMLRCDCKGTCQKKSCSCFKAERQYNSRCHKRNITCMNLED